MGVGLATGGLRALRCGAWGAGPPSGACRRACPEGGPGRWAGESRLRPLCAHKAPCRPHLASVPGRGRGVGGTFSWGEPRSPRPQPPPRGRAGPQPRPRARAASRGYCCANTVHCGPRLRSPPGKRRRAALLRPSARGGGPGGDRKHPEAGCGAGPAPLSRLGLSFVLSLAAYQLFAAQSGTQVPGL